MEKLNMNASVLVVAGAETSATTLSAATYLLMSHPNKMSKLLAEIRGTFKNEDEITIATVTRLEYMLACLDEAMRLFPPVAIGLPRIVPGEGRSISGYFIPGNVCSLLRSNLWLRRGFTDNSTPDSCIRLALGSISKPHSIYQTLGLLPGTLYGRPGIFI